MAKLIIKNKVVAPKNEERSSVGTLTLGINMFVPVSTSIKKPIDYISQDKPNALILGSDEKLFVDPNPDVGTDFNAYYILTRG